MLWLLKDGHLICYRERLRIRGDFCINLAGFLAYGCSSGQHCDSPSLKAFELCILVYQLFSKKPHLRNCAWPVQVQIMKARSTAFTMWDNLLCRLINLLQLETNIKHVIQDEKDQYNHLVCPLFVTTQFTMK